GLETAGDKLQGAAASVDQARADIERRKAESGKQLDSAGGGLAKARQMIRQGGPDLEKRFASASGHVAQARADLDAKEAEMEAKRAKLAQGTVYVYPAPEKTPPRFWIRKATFSGTHVIDGETFALEGTATNLCSDLAQLGEDATIELSLKAGGKKITARVRAT